MNTPSDLFNLYESYLGIYEDLDEANRWERESGIGGNSPEAEMARKRSRAYHTGSPKSKKAVNPSDIDDSTLKINRELAQMIHKRNRGKSPTDPTYRHRKKIDPLKIPSYRDSPLSLPKGYKDPLNPRTNNQNPKRLGDRVNANVKPLPTEVHLNTKSNIRKFQRNDVEYVLDYLIDEGYTDSHEGAIEIVECMSDEWLEGIIEGFVPLSPEKEERVRDKVEQNVAEREAATKDMRKHRDRLRSLPKPLRRFSRSNKAAIELLNKYDRNPKGLNKKNLLQNAQDSLMHTSISRQASNVAKQNELKRKLKDLNASVEYILDYLIDEGYADSYKSSVAILETMSDDWFDQIVEAFKPSDYAEYHRKNHQDDADDRSEERDKEYLDYLDSKKDIRDKHNQARGVKKKRGAK